VGARGAAILRAAGFCFLVNLWRHNVGGATLFREEVSKELNRFLAPCYTRLALICCLWGTRSTLSPAAQIGGGGLGKNVCRNETMTLKNDRTELYNKAGVGDAAAGKMVEVLSGIEEGSTSSSSFSRTTTLKKCQPNSAKVSAAAERVNITGASKRGRNIALQRIRVHIKIDIFLWRARLSWAALFLLLVALYLRCAHYIPYFYI